ncbi:MAG: hypothetical protein F6J87_31470, partial [Spirulina sp. SIO3F2]|nr:hypothetical protein [Spirulina sp. SIO3F2]
LGGVGNTLLRLVVTGVVLFVLGAIVGGAVGMAADIPSLGMIRHDPSIPRVGRGGSMSISCICNYYLL